MSRIHIKLSNSYAHCRFLNPKNEYPVCRVQENKFSFATLLIHTTSYDLIDFSFISEGQYTWPLLFKQQDCLRISGRTTRECIHLVTRVHFRSRDKDGGYTIRISIRHTRKPHAVRKHHGSVFDRTGVIAGRSFTLREYWDFGPFLLLWPWPWPDDLHVRTGPVSPGDIPVVQIVTSYVKTFESYRLTDIQTDALI